jgi:sulfatase maturation enzyme AslB (radical SAM superfamily)
MLDVTVSSAAEDERARAKTLMATMTNPYNYTRDELAEMSTWLTKDDLREIFSHDPYLYNFALNHWEFVHGVAEMESFPWNVVVPIADLCNASCTFCNSWLRGKRLLKMEELDNFREVLPYAAMIGLEGHGEPLIHPQFRKIIARLNELIDPRCRSYIITNAVHLDDHLDDLVALGVGVYNISLNAATRQTHQKVMDLGEDGFERAVAAIRRLIEIREAGVSRNPISINVSLVVTADNVHEAADFIRLCNTLKVDLVNLRTLLPQTQPVDGLNYHLLPAYLAPDFETHLADAKAAIAASETRVAADPDSWRNPVFPAHLEAEYAVKPPPTYTRSQAKTFYKDTRGDEVKELFNVTSRGEKMTSERLSLMNYDNQRRGDREAWFHCWDVYAILHMNDFFFFMRPCCYMENTPGYEWVKYDGSYPFMQAWNSPGMVALRRSLRDGPLHAMCTQCPVQTQFPAAKQKRTPEAAVPAVSSAKDGRSWFRLFSRK